MHFAGGKNRISDKISSLYWQTIFVMICHYSLGHSMFEICAARANDNQRIGYSAHATDCDKCIQCRYNQEGVLEGQIQQCAFSTYWNNVKWTCTPTNYTSCPNDR